MAQLFKIGLGYGIQSNAEVLGYEEEISRGIFAFRETDAGYYDIPLYSRFKQVEYKGVPHPLSGDYTPREQEDIDDSLYEYGKYGPQPQSPSPTESDASSLTVSSDVTSNLVGSLDLILASQNVNSGSVHVNTARVFRPVSNQTSYKTSPKLSQDSSTEAIWRIEDLFTFGGSNGSISGRDTSSFVGYLPRVAKNDHTCVACQKGKQHKASCKAKIDRFVTHPLHTLHMDLFGPTSVRSINHASYCLVIIDDCSRFCWVFFLAKKDETSDILKTFIRQIENQLNQKVKIIRTDNGTEFKNRVMLEFCGEKGIKQEFSNARTPQQNGVAERMNRTLIEAARTMLADSHLPTTFWAEAELGCLAMKHFGPVPATAPTSTHPVNTEKSQKALEDEIWVEAMQDELLQSSYSKVWYWSDLPMVLSDRQEEGIDYDEVFAPVTRIEAIRLFLSFASFMGFIDYQMDVKSAFLYGTIDEWFMSQTPSWIQGGEPFERLYSLEEDNKDYHVGLQVKQKKGESSYLTDKYVLIILKKFALGNVKDAIHSHGDQVGPLTKDEEALFLCCVSRFQVTPMTISSQCCQEWDLQVFRANQTWVYGILGNHLLIWKHFSDSDLVVPTLLDNPQQVVVNFLVKDLSHGNLEFYRHSLDAKEEWFAEIVDFLRGSNLRYALTANPPIYDSLVKQFWQSAITTSNADGPLEISATIDTIRYSISEASIRDSLQLDDATGITMLPNADLFEGMRQIGSKSGGWDQFGSNIATALICLSSGRVYNFSKLIFDGMVANLKSKTKFLMYPCFLQMNFGIVQTEDKTLFVLDKINVCCRPHQPSSSTPQAPITTYSNTNTTTYPNTKHHTYSNTNTPPIPTTTPTPYQTTIAPLFHTPKSPPPPLEDWNLQQMSPIYEEQSPGPIDKGRRYKRRKETKGKKVVSSLDFQEEVDDVAEQVNTAGEVNTAASTVGEDKGQREGKAPMLSEETPKKSKEQILQEEASLAEAIRLDSLQKEKEAKQIHLDASPKTTELQRRRVDMDVNHAERKGDEAKEECTTKKLWKEKKADGEERKCIQVWIRITLKIQIRLVSKKKLDRYGMDGQVVEFRKGFWKCLKSMDVYMLSDRKYPLSAESDDLQHFTMKNGNPFNVNIKQHSVYNNDSPILVCYPYLYGNPDIGTAMEYRKALLASLGMSALDKPHIQLENLSSRFIHDSNPDGAGTDEGVTTSFQLSKDDVRFKGLENQSQKTNAQDQRSLSMKEHSLPLQSSIQRHKTEKGKAHKVKSSSGSIM
ncbi:putative ribonuclease H-like domain-containing protein [Tanacetum coccineum]